VADIQALRNEITERFALGRFDQGNRLLAQYGPVLPEHVKLECLGNRHFYYRNFQEAVECYEGSISLEPDYLIARYQYLVGVQEEREGDFVSAFKRYQAAIGIEPSFVDPYVELGGLLVKVEDFQGAAQCYRDALRIAPSDAANYLNLRAVLNKLLQIEPEGSYGDELAEVETAYATVAKANPENLSNHRW
jgi:tetratricopeptide (TPR) repeat protein